MRALITIAAVFLAAAMAGCAGRDRELRRRQWLDDVDACMASRQTFDQDCSLAEPK